MRQLRLALLSLALAAPLGAQTPATRDVPAPIRRVRDQMRREYSGDSAKAVVARMDHWFRWPGNPGYDSSVTLVEGILRRAGYVEESKATPRDRLVYRLEARPMANPAWNPIDAELAIVGQPAPLLRWATNRNMLAINSYSTPDTGVVAELVDGTRGPASLDSLSVAGKIVLMAQGSPRAFGEAVSKRGALGVLAYAMPAYTQPEKNTTLIQFHSIPRDTVKKSWALDLSYGAYQALKSALAAGPVRVRVRTRAEFMPGTERMIVAEVRGSARPDERFVLSAHLQEPGANDNASGVGTLAEMARWLANSVRSGTVNPKRSVTMIFGNEIAQTRHFLSDSARARSTRWGMSLDMTGEDVTKTGGTFLIEKMPDPSAVWTRGDEKHSEWGGEKLEIKDIKPHYYNDVVLDRCLDEAAGTGWVVRTNPFEGGSDHTPFLTANKPGVLLWHFTDQFYHTDNDRLDKVSAAEQKHVGICATLTALTLASADGALTRTLGAQLAANAAKRLDTELALSRAAVAKGGDRAQERTILETWTSYYRDAILKLEDVEVGGPSAETKARLKALADRVTAAGAKAIAALG